MGHYIKYNKNYWDRKIFDENSKFDTEILKHQSVGINKSQNLFKKYVELVCLEMSYYCNRACSYCPVAIYERSDKNLEIDNELFLSIINSLKKIDYAGRISLNLFNEPLASKNFLERVKKLNNNLPKAILSCNSNGDYVKNSETFTKLDQSGLKEILITLHPAKNTSWTKSYAQKSIKRFAKKIGHPLSDIELEKLKFSFMVNKLYIEVVCTNWDNSGNSRGGTMKHLIPDKIRVNPCEKPIREFVISYDGSVHLCCHSYQNKEIDNSMSKVDKLDDDSIFKIYTNKILTDARKELFSYSKKSGICETCNHYENNIRTGLDFFLTKEDKKKREKILDKI
jgi:hypothetical protein